MMRITLLLATALCLAAPAQADTLFRNVRVFDGQSPTLSAPTSVLVRGNRIAAIGPSAAAPGATIVEGRGRTLMPGLIDVHVHLTFSALSMPQLMAPDLTPAKAEAAAAAEASAMLLRGFTAVRDLGGPIFSLKAGIDAGRYQGPRVWPSGATISQTAGHGDFRTPAERSRRFFGKPVAEPGATSYRPVVVLFGMTAAMALSTGLSRGCKWRSSTESLQRV